MSDWTDEARERLSERASQAEYVNSESAVVTVADIRAALGEIERLDFLHKQDHSLADQWLRRAEAAEREYHHHAHGPNCREAKAEAQRLRRLHEALLDTLTPSKSAWIQKVVKNARAAMRGGGE